MRCGGEVNVAKVFDRRLVAVVHCIEPSHLPVVGLQGNVCVLYGDAPLEK